MAAFFKFAANCSIVTGELSEFWKSWPGLDPLMAKYCCRATTGHGVPRG